MSTEQEYWDIFTGTGFISAEQVIEKKGKFMGRAEALDRAATAAAKFTHVDIFTGTVTELPNVQEGVAKGKEIS